MDGKHERKSSEERKAPDSRRRFRARSGAARSALTTLADALQMRGKYLTGLRVLLVGFTELPPGEAQEGAREIESTLRRHGANVTLFTASEGAQFEQRREELLRAIQDADVVLIDTDSSLTRAVRPKEMRERGVGIIVATTLNA